MKESKKKVEFEKYTLKPNDSELVKFIEMANAPKIQTATLLQEEKVAIAGCFPPLVVPLKWRKGITYDHYKTIGNVRGTSYLRKVSCRRKLD